MAPWTATRARLSPKAILSVLALTSKRTFAPTVCYSTICTILAIAALEDLELRSVDISHAYLNGTLEEEIGPDYVCRLKKSLYGIKQAGRVWTKTLHAVLTSTGFRHVQSDHGLYALYKDNVKVFMTVKDLSQHFKICDLGPTTQLPGWSIEQHDSEGSL